MTTFKYTLEPYQGSNTKHLCPGCNKRTFTRYIDSETSEYVNETVGRCDREINCGYHYKPAQYFQDNGEGKKVFVCASLPTLATPKVYIPLEILQKSRSAYHKNTFVQHLLTLFDEATVNRLISAYHLGTSDGRWPGSCVFWFIDIQGRIHAGQVKLFDKGHTASFEGEKCTTWIHSILKRKLSPVPAWLTQYCDPTHKRVTCFFGEHLIAEKPIVIVEAPATAIVASAYLPQFTWVAAGSLGYLNTKKCEVLRGHKVVLYPDLGAYDKWKEIADNLGFDCSNLLEENATLEDKAKGLDLRDYLERFSISEFIKPTGRYYETLKDGREILMHPAGYPMDWNSNPLVKELIDRLDLRIN